MILAVDVKNLALFSGGIAAFFSGLLEAWVKARPSIRFVMVGPELPNAVPFQGGHVTWHQVDWPVWLPRPLRHPYYDNVLFPRAIRQVRPDIVFTPYHDVRCPRGIPAVMMIHDTCIGDLPDSYPFKIRAYYQHMLKVNLARACHILTVSETSRACILDRYDLGHDRVTVVPNTLDPVFLQLPDGGGQNVPPQGRGNNEVRLFYAGGSEYRKNVSRLVDALQVLVARGYLPQLFVTGTCDGGWSKALAGAPGMLRERIRFLGRLGVAELCAAYRAADAVVYPTLCEGFGRACLEAMALGVPIACSDLPVLREVAGDYPAYFDPLSPESIAEGILAALMQGHRPPRHDVRFDRLAVAQHFIETMDGILSRECGHA